MELEDKAAIVTGAETGVRRQTALQLADGGCSGLVDYSRSRQGAEVMIEECERRARYSMRMVAAGILSILTAPDMTTGHVFPHEGGVTISI